ncbi:beta-ketoacyl synthase N-terminal-like domain-containing protein [Streptomyces coffeae]|uniref:Beta-ketoacyl synthase n=1 Tax=Streptomyces coffeae TaxID=621382 RepID=A0ABS1NHZ8_9ACTN|nr:beta-ketoacyl synthase N-terminal-like domain-containing protein [Streptomyces coffeae]MBL1099683.1 beta-ketoacyl synthase [Streptomyces coffeae]
MTASPDAVVVSGVGLALPGAGTPDTLLRNARPAPGPSDRFDTTTRIGRRGHRYKDRATRLALCAALDALRDAALVCGEDAQLTVPGATVGVVGSSNLGNLDTACLTAATIAEDSACGLSPMSLPNASSNVIASWVAIRHGLRGPNLMLCNGPTSGLDAVHWGATLVAAGRVRRALVVGVETHNPVVEELAGAPAGDLLDGAAAVVVEGARWAREREARTSAVLGPYVRRPGLGPCVAALLPEGPPPGVWFTPERYKEPAGAAVPVPGTVPRHDLSVAFGRASGALGVLQCAAAVGWLAADGSGDALLTSGDDTADAVAGLLLRPTTAPRPGQDGPFSAFSASPASPASSAMSAISAMESP